LAFNKYKAINLERESKILRFFVINGLTITLFNLINLLLIVEKNGRAEFCGFIQTLPIKAVVFIQKMVFLIKNICLKYNDLKCSEIS